MSTGKEILTAPQVLAEYEDGRRMFHEVRIEGASFIGADLEGASFCRAGLRGANFTGAHLTHVQLKNADLTGAVFVDAWMNASDLIAGNFKDADLQGCDLTGASMNYSDFRRADLRRTNLGNAIFEDTNLTGARFVRARLGTHISNTDVGAMCDVKSITHTGPSSIDARTIMKSYRHPRLKPFLLACGVPEVFAEYMIDCARALGDDILLSLMQSTFISYGGPDEAFARRLYEALKAHGVVVFYFPESARLGRRIGDEVFQGLQTHDRMIVLCSEASLTRPGVLNEIRETLDREARDGGASYLIPVMLDDYLLTGWPAVEPELAERVGRRVAGDFTGATKNKGAFDHALTRLLDALKRKHPGGLS